MNFRYSPLDLAFTISLTLWLAASIWFAWIGDGETFPRLGAALIAAVAMYFALMPPLNVNPHDYAESKKLTSLRINLNTRSIMDVRENTGTLAAFLVDFLREQNVTPPEAICNLTGLASDEARRRSGEIDFEDFNRRDAAIAAQMGAADNQVRKVKVNGVRRQAVYISIGTLQWGFGDLVSSFTS